MGFVCFDDRGEMHLLRDVLSSVCILRISLCLSTSMNECRSDTMRNLMKKNVTKQYRNRIILQGSLGMLIVLALLLVACGGASTSESSGASVNAPAHQVASKSAQASSSSSGQTTKSSTSFGAQYLIKSLHVNMLVKDTRQVASDLQSWIATTD